MKASIGLAMVMAAGVAMAAEPAATATVTVDMKAELGPVKPMGGYRVRHGYHSELPQ